MEAGTLLLGSTALSIVGSVLALALGRSESISKTFAGIFGALAGLFALASGVTAILGSIGTGVPAQILTMTSAFPFADFTLRFDALSGLLLVVLAILSIAAWIYSLSYADEYVGRIGKMGFFLNLFIPSMNFVVLADNAFWFCIFFELMSLTSYFLVTIEEKEEGTRAGFLYLVMAHAGLLMIMASFFLMGNATGSLDFESFRTTTFSPTVASLVFLLTFIGFGIKAGMIPFHSWLPMAHPSAPSHVSALMSGGMIKIGVFGIVLTSFDLLGSSEPMLWWGIVIIVFGAISSVLGVMYALVEHDLKRLLAFHSVENIGIIFLGVGIGLVGVALDAPVVAGLGLLGGLFHLFNHAMFKGLLFLGAGSVMYSTGTKNMEALGGLGRLMPYTGIMFLIGCLAISAIPPLNGFASEWYIYQSMLATAWTSGPVVQVIIVVSAVALAITGALAVTCFVKAYGITFAGMARTERAAQAKEVPGTMIIGQAILTIICIAFGVLAPFVAGYFMGIAKFLVGVPGVPAPSEGLLMVGGNTTDITSTLMIAILLISGVVIALIFRSVLGTGKSGVKENPWGCGYEYSTRMPVIASSFANEMERFYSPLYEIRDRIVETGSRFKGAFEATVRGARRVEPVGDRYLVDSTARGVEKLSDLFSKLEHGNFRVYCTYIVVALIVVIALALTLG